MFIFIPFLAFKIMFTYSGVTVNWHEADENISFQNLVCLLWAEIEWTKASTIKEQKETWKVSIITRE
jgi:hypothetical protein